jgi:hypothetical protein
VEQGGGVHQNFLQAAESAGCLDHVKMQKCLQPAVDRFNGIEERPSDRRFIGRTIRGNQTVGMNPKRPVLI